ncbi:MAG: FAD-dependent oxidoreductase [Thermoguttaceae bacterium]|jgi:flavin-dependent dehydrogenase|nr:FAD-dependent oxidoreductase [Thermoguttaceae bacterium]
MNSPACSNPLSPQRHFPPAPALVVVAAVCLAFTPASLAAGKVVRESARAIPLAYDVDVVVVGGSSAGVAAAVAAAEQGAKVFLAAPRPYLGEDICATYRLWLEPDEQPSDPLAKELYHVPPVLKGIRYTYQADQPSVGKHVDTDPPSMLADGKWGTAFTQSVQYDDDTTISIDLGKQEEIGKLHVMFYQGPGSFEVESMTFEASDDGRQWTPLAVIENDQLGKGSFVETAIHLTREVRASARYLRCLAKKTARAPRMLLGEILVERAGADEAPGGMHATTPMQVKRSLDQALLDAGVSFLYGCYPTELLRDANGELAGIVMANRAGRQAVKAKVIIDATDRAWVARMSGARFAPYPAGPQEFKRIVVGGLPRSGPGVASRRVRLLHAIGGKSPIQFGTGTWATKYNVPMTKSYSELIEYTLTIPMRDGSFASFAEAEQVARDRTFHPEQVEESEVLLQVPPDPMEGEVRQSGAWPGAATVDLGALRPKGVARLLVLGGCADVSREAAAELIRPLEQIRVGRRIGEAAAAEAKSVAALAGVHLPGVASTSAVPGEVGEPLAGLRPTQQEAPTIPAEARDLPVIGQYDVVVVGGGTGGAPAGIGAAREGAKTLVVEYLHGLGGVGTTGLIGIYCAGYREGFTAETEAGIAKIGAPSYIIGKKEWWRSEIRKAQGDIWFGTLGCGALVEDGRVTGAIIVTPQGRGVVLARTVVDGTGHADVAAAAGAECMYTCSEHIALQGAGLPQSEPGASYINTDWTFIDESDMIDVWSAKVVAKQRYPDAYDMGQLVDTRERRRVVGDYVLTPLDIVTQRTFPDTVGISNGGKLDKHGYTVHPFYMINNWHGGMTYTPYRCLLPKGLDGILVIGIGLSAHVDAIPSVRMQPGVQNLGYAAGVAAAMAAKGGTPTRRIDLAQLRKHLVAIGCLTPEVLEHGDSFPLPDARVEAAVRKLAEKDYSGLGVIMASEERSIPLMQAAYRSGATSPEGKLRCAHVLGMMGDATGIETLIAKVREAEEFDEERIDRYFPWVTWLDSYIIALGRTRDPRALEPLLEKLAMLGEGAGNRVSHYRALALAFEALGDPAAALPLGEAMKKLGITGTAVTEIEGLTAAARGRTGQRDLAMARVLFRLGDHEEIGRSILEQYAHDVRGHYVRHARAVLEKGPDLRE